MKPGERLPTEKQLTEELAVSRTCVREAIKSLESLQLISVRPKIGAVVLEPSPVALINAEYLSTSAFMQQADSLIEFRKVLELGLVALAAEKSTEAADAQSLPPDVSLGDVARRFRKQKESQKLQRSAEFHLPFADAPVLSRPKPPVMPLRPPVSNPAPPKFVPYRPPVKRSPFERPRVFVAPPSLPLSRPPAARIAPLQPAAPVAPAAPIVPVAPSGAAKLTAVIVMPGDSLWKIAGQNLGKGRRWRELLSVNPAIRDANHIKAGSQVFLPVVTSSARTSTKITVKKGDTLTAIARAHLGHASYWSCIAKENPAVREANMIFEGQVLLVPAGCKR